MYVKFTIMHQEKHLKSSEFITGVVIGDMSDGLTVPVALAAA